MQAEYAALGQRVPSRLEIIMGNAPALSTVNIVGYSATELPATVERIEAGVDTVYTGIENVVADVVDSVKSAGPAVVLGLVAVAVIYGMSKLPGGRK